MTQRKTTRVEASSRSRPKPVPTVTPPATAFVPPYRASWSDKIIDQIERLPWPPWVTGGLVIALTVAAVHLDAWMIRRSLPRGVFSANDVGSAVWGGYALAGSIYARRWAEQALNEFRPVVSKEMGSFESLKYRMTRVPMALGSLVIAGNILLFLLIALSAPAMGLIPDTLLLVWIGATLWAYVIAGHWLALVLRQLLQVARLYRMIPEFHLIRRDPLYALSRLTQRSGAALAILVTVGWLANASTLSEPLTAGSALTLVGIQAGMVMFISVSPLWGAHVRLVDEKRRQQAESDQRTITALDRLHDGLERDDGPTIERQHKALLAIQFEQQALAKVPTWPWTPGIVRSAVGAIFLPILVWLLQYVLQEVIG